MTVFFCVFWMSTVGDSPVTVSVSVTLPTVRSALTVTVFEPVNSMFSRLTVVNPDRVNVTL
jgi:hypothetical protein